ncbi:DUF2797 domain-containing protein [Streptomyces sp. NBC_01525]|uniref:DUF2797 domain-containing protein n=1 Tax=Streptomyces sp. NBC_01525 TaxID=2903893 RepID=UPI0038662D27
MEGEAGGERGFRQGLGWYCAERGAERVSALTAGKWLAFSVVGERRCLGVRRGGRWIVCPYEAAIPGAAARDQCEACARLDRSRSVAADTMADDPRPYGVYLAYFGPGLVKVGITAAERGAARLVEQGAVAYAWLGRGPLMAARRAEAVLGSALAVPDRFAKEAKRAARGVLPAVAERRAELAELHARARGLPGWPETLEPVDFTFGDHSELFGLARIPADAAELGAMAAGAEVVGEVLAGAGTDVYVRVRIRGVSEVAGAAAEGGVFAPGAGAGAGARAAAGAGSGGGPGGGLRRSGEEGAVGEVVAVLDARLLSGWVLGAARGEVTTVPVRVASYGRGGRRGGEEGDGGQEGLF